MNLSSVQKIEKKRGQLSFSLQKMKLTRSIRGSGEKSSAQIFQGFGRKQLRRIPSKGGQLLRVKSKTGGNGKKLVSSELKDESSVWDKLRINQSLMGEDGSI